MWRGNRTTSLSSHRSQLVATQDSDVGKVKPFQTLQTFRAGGVNA